jgi:hypothetical protein
MLRFGSEVLRKGPDSDGICRYIICRTNCQGSKSVVPPTAPSRKCFRFQQTTLACGECSITIDGSVKVMLLLLEVILLIPLMVTGRGKPADLRR